MAVDAPMAPQSKRPISAALISVKGSDGKPLVAVQRPRAVDAQGAPVPVTLEVAGNNFVLRVPHIATPVTPIRSWWIQSSSTGMATGLGATVSSAGRRPATGRTTRPTATATSANWPRSSTCSTRSGPGVSEHRHVVELDRLTFVESQAVRPQLRVRHRLRQCHGAGEHRRHGGLPVLVAFARASIAAIRRPARCGGARIAKSSCTSCRATGRGGLAAAPGRRTRPGRKVAGGAVIRRDQEDGAAPGPSGISTSPASR